MPKKLFCLSLATLIAGMTAFAPYLAGQCASPGVAMPGMAAHGTSPAAGPEAMAMGAIAAPAAAAHTPASAHHHACCNTCLGPCSTFDAAVLPPAAVALVPLTLPPSARPAPAAARVPSAGLARLLPFANGPPSYLG